MVVAFITLISTKLSLAIVPLHLVLDLLALAQGAEVLRRAIGAGWQAPGAGAPGPSDELVPRRGWDPWPAVHASLPIRPVTTTASPSCASSIGKIYLLFVPSTNKRGNLVTRVV